MRTPSFHEWATLSVCHNPCQSPRTLSSKQRPWRSDERSLQPRITSRLDCSAALAAAISAAWPRLLTAGASLPFYNEAALAQGLSATPNLPPDAVKINANENPMGPCPEAAEAIHKIVSQGGRYLYNETFAFSALMAEVEGISREHVMPFAGSSDPLHRAVLAFTGPEKSYVVANPGYEAGARAARFIGAKTISVPLRKDYAHDVHAMAQADPNAGLIYVCNPNNPTGSITSKEDIEYLVAHKPKDAIVLLDEAYIHLSKTAEPASALVAADKDVIILRTFSKLYGMAGLRAGAALGARLDRQAAGLRSRSPAGHRHGGRDRQPEVQGVGPGAQKDHWRYPRRDRRVARQTRIHRPAIRSKHDHDRRPAPGPGGLSGSAQGKSRHRPDLALDAKTRAQSQSEPATR